MYYMYIVLATLRTCTVYVPVAPCSLLVGLPLVRSGVDETIFVQELVGFGRSTTTEHTLEKEGGAMGGTFRKDTGWESPCLARSCATEA